MCTRPNFMRYENKLLTLKKSDYNSWQFIPHVDFDKILEQSIRENFSIVPIPCGQCLECRLNHAQQWADRCTMEAMKYKYNWFITLTYDDDHYPVNGSLNIGDLQNFMKRLRKKFPDYKVRYFACGEYGDTSLRPHYHMALFNLPLNDLSYEFEQFKNGKYISYLRPNNKGQLQYSRTIYDLWQHKGIISIAPFTYETACYISQYVTKKVEGRSKKFYLDHGLAPEFITMSRRPGLGYDYYDKKMFVDNIVYQNYADDYGVWKTKKSASLQKQKIILPASGNARIVNQLPRYFEKQFEKDFPDLFIKYKQAKALNNVLSINEMLLKKTRQKELDIRDYKNKKRRMLQRSAI